MTTKRKAGRPSNNDSRRTEILEKATECFTRNGYSKTTLDEIGDALGFNKAALYYYYKDKEELFKNVIQLAMKNLWDEIKSKTIIVNGMENKLLKYFEVKTKGWLRLLNINGISRENLINLNASFAESIMLFRKSELEFLKECLGEVKNKYTEKETEEFLNLLIETQTDLTMSAILLFDIVKNPEKFEETKAMKDKLLIHFINSYQQNYIPD